MAMVAVAAPAGWADVFRVSPVSIREGNWTYRAIYQSDAEPNRVRAIVAIADPDTVIGNSINVVCYDRSDEVQENPLLVSWTSRAWSAANVGDVLTRIRANLDWPEEDDGLWELPTVGSGGQVIADGRPFDKGLYLDDPFYAALVGTPSGDDIVAWLAEIGYPAAKLPTERVSEADSASKYIELNAISSGIELYIRTGDELDSFLLAKTLREPSGYNVPYYIPAAAQCFRKWTYATKVLAGATSCSAWTTSPNIITIGEIVTLSTTSSTCYAQTCVEWQSRYVLWTNVCTNATGYYYEYQWSSYRMQCCVSGIGAPPPPLPCVPTRTEIDDSGWKITPPLAPDGTPPPATLPPQTTRPIPPERSF
ncbi:MAG: hypothetical protein K2X32_12765 [Phycisphaerales bacterium]|nr:hypothetical protein [Phycisphaerales bacterium]